MPKITALAWDEENIAHIAKHNVSPREVEEVCFSSSHVIFRAAGGRYIVLGQTDAGRYLKVVVHLQRRGPARVITALDMSKKERRRYRELSRR